MNKWLWLATGIVAGGPVWVGATVWTMRRLWQVARRLAARSRGHEQLVELGHLTGGLAHEIKNPLSTINLNLSLLAEDLARSADEQHHRWLRRLEGVQGEADRLKEILNDFLRYAGKCELDLELLDLRRVVGELVDFFAPQADAAHVVLRTTLGETPLRCRLDPRLIKQALLNLMINAVQAMTAGGELLIRLSSQRGDAVVEVIDTGPGISPQDLTKVFEAYFSTKPKGSGLGLSTTRRIILEHDGQIRVESEPGKGTRFIITLPATDQ